MAGVPVPILPDKLPEEPFPSYAFRRTQDINTADIYGADRISGFTVGGLITPGGEPPWDGYIYGVRNGLWVRDVIQTAPPNDGNVYGYTSAGWVNVTNLILNIDLDAGTY